MDSTWRTIVGRRVCISPKHIKIHFALKTRFFFQSLGLFGVEVKANKTHSSRPLQHMLICNCARVLSLSYDYFLSSMLKEWSLKVYCGNCKVLALVSLPNHLLPIGHGFSKSNVWCSFFCFQQLG